MPQVLWLRNDLRLHDHEGILKAAARPEPLAILYLLPSAWLEEDNLGISRLGGAKAQLLRAALIELYRQLKKKDQHLYIFSGDPVDIFTDIKEQCEQEKLTILTESAKHPEEKLWISSLLQEGIEFDFYDAQTLFSSEQVSHLNANFPINPEEFSNIIEADSRFWKVNQENAQPRLTNLPFSINIHHAVHWPVPQYETETPPYYGELGAIDWLNQYLWCGNTKNDKGNQGLSVSSSHLNDHLTCGCLSVRYLWHQVNQYDSRYGESVSSRFIRNKLLQREFYYWSTERKAQEMEPEPTQKQLTKLSKPDLSKWQDWCNANTGVAQIDKDLNQLRCTGYLPQGKMVSLMNYLVHELNLNWQLGAKWFEMHLACFDIASLQINHEFLEKINVQE